MAYLLVHTGDTSGAEDYGLALVWISPHQVQAYTMEEALGTLSACISSGPNCPHVLAQLYEGSNHTPLPKDKHLGVLPQGKVEESPSWADQPAQSLPAPICWAMSCLSSGLKWGNQPVTINLPELLPSGSSITTDEHPHMRIDITLTTPEEPECTTLPLGRVPAILAATTPRTPWKPRISLAAKTNDLLKWGMVEILAVSQNAAMGEVGATKVDVSLPHKSEVPAPPLDTSSQASVEEGEASLESNPINVSPTMAAVSSHSESPVADLTELQENANLAVDHMLLVQRSTDLRRQWVVWELGVLLHWNEAEEAAANERARVHHSQGVLNAKVECTKTVMEAKYKYRTAI